MQANTIDQKLLLEIRDLLKEIAGQISQRAGMDAQIAYLSAFTSRLETRMALLERVATETDPIPAMSPKSGRTT